jgi:hypothetical protein
MIELTDSSGNAFRIGVMDMAENHLSYSYDNGNTLMLYKEDGTVYNPPLPYNHYGAFFSPHGTSGDHTAHPLGA